MRRVIIVLLVVSVVLVGCIAGEGEDDEDPVNDEWDEAVRLALPEDPLPAGGDHDHGDTSAHRFLWNYEFSHRDPMQQDTARTAGLHALQVADGHLFGAVYGHHAASANGGLYVWSLEDPAAPRMKGHAPVPGHVGGDRSLGVTPDGDFAVLGVEQLSCFGHVNPVPINAYLVDTRDKANPIVVDAVEVPVWVEGDEPRYSLGTHSVWVQNIGGQDYAFIWGQVYRIDRGGPTGAGFVDMETWVRVGHDMYVRDTPWGGFLGLGGNGQQFPCVQPDGPD